MGRMGRIGSKKDLSCQMRGLERATDYVKSSNGVSLRLIGWYTRVRLIIRIRSYQSMI